MSKTDVTFRIGRRGLLTGALLAPLAAWAASAHAQDAVCVDLSALSPSEQSMRSSLGFKPVSDDPKRTCGGCAFFTAADPATCGKCQLLSGGAVSAASRCDSWAARQQ